MKKSPITKSIFRIRHAKTGLYKKGGSYDTWGKQGKVWVGSGPLKSHLNQYAKMNYDTKEISFPKDSVNWIIEEIEIKEEIITSQSVAEIYAERAKKIQEKAEKEQRARDEHKRKKQQALSKLSADEKRTLGLA